MDRLTSNFKQMRQYRFLLNVAKSEEQEIAEMIRDLKSKRSFSHAIRTGLRLFWSLMQGRTDILVEEFPWVVEQLQSPLGQLQEQLDRIETKLATTSNLPPIIDEETPEQFLPSASRQPIVITDLEADERMNIKVEQAKILDNPTYNILISVASIDATGFIGLDLDVLEYGISQGKIPAHFLDQKRALLAEKAGDTAPTIPIEVPDAKRISGADQIFSLPESLEMDEIDW